jgi:putative ABC transport system substrate-binding protein
LRRREFISLIAGAATWPVSARGQEAGRVRRIGALSNLSESDPEIKRRNEAKADCGNAAGLLAATC